MGESRSWQALPSETKKALTEKAANVRDKDQLSQLILMSSVLTAAGIDSGDTFQTFKAIATVSELKGLEGEALFPEVKAVWGKINDITEAAFDGVPQKSAKRVR